jgi:hypothetical protein
MVLWKPQFFVHFGANALFFLTLEGSPFIVLFFFDSRSNKKMALAIVLVALAVLIYAAPCILMALLSARLRVGSRVSPR